MGTAAIWLRALPPAGGTRPAAPRRQLTAQQGPDTDEEGHADDERGGNRGKILQHTVTLPGRRQCRSGQPGPRRGTPTPL